MTSTSNDFLCIFEYVIEDCKAETLVAHRSFEDRLAPIAEERGLELITPIRSKISPLRLVSILRRARISAAQRPKCLTKTV